MALIFRHHSGTLRIGLWGWASGASGTKRVPVGVVAAVQCGGVAAIKGWLVAACNALLSEYADDSSDSKHGVVTATGFLKNGVLIAFFFHHFFHR